MAHEISIVDVGRLRPVVNPFKPVVHRFNRLLWQRFIGATNESFTTIYDHGRLSIHRVYDPEVDDPTEDMGFAAGMVGTFAYMFPVTFGALGLILLADFMSVINSSFGGIGAAASIGVLALGSAVLLAAADAEYEVELDEEAATVSEVFN